MLSWADQRTTPAPGSTLRLRAQRANELIALEQEMAALSRLRQVTGSLLSFPDLIDLCPRVITFQNGAQPRWFPGLSSMPNGRRWGCSPDPGGSAAAAARAPSLFRHRSAHGSPPRRRLNKNWNRTPQSGCRQPDPGAGWPRRLPRPMAELAPPARRRHSRRLAPMNPASATGAPLETFTDRLSDRGPRQQRGST